MKLHYKEVCSSPSGIHAHFMRQENGTGLKLYRNKERRDNAYDQQFALAEAGLSPICCDKVAIFVEKDSGDTENWFGYYTEVATVFSYKLHSQLMHADEDLDDDHPRKLRYEAKMHYRRLWQTHAAELGQFVNDLFAIEWVDNHAGNVGVLDGKLVIIDTADVDLFSPETESLLAEYSENNLTSELGVVSCR